MTQNIVNYANNPTGPELLDDYLAKEQQNNLTSNSGIQRPSYVQAGTKWLDTSSTPWVWKMFDGSSDVILGTVDPTTHTFSATGLDTAVLLTGNQTVGGVKTFSNNPLVPNVTTGDNSSKVANTAFVAAGLATKQNTLIAGRNIVISGNEISSTADSRDVGEIIKSTIPLTNANLHGVDGSLISGSGIYTAFVNHIADLYDSGTASSCFCSEADWQSAVTTYGVCGKYVYDSINNTVRIPKYNSKIYTGGGIANSKGNGKTLGLTNGSGTTTSLGEGIPGLTASGLGQYNYNEQIGTTGSAVYSGNYVRMGITTDSTKSGIITDLSTITTAVDGYWYIVVATSPKTEIQVDIDQIATDLNGKADKDLTNVSNTSGLRKLIEVYNNGASWYKIFAEYDKTTGNFIGNWCEQGGMLEATLSSSPQHVTLLVPYKDTNYDIKICVLYTSGETNGQEYVVKSSITKDDFYTLFTGNKKWSAEGYIN